MVDKKILITGATDGIGLEAAFTLAAQGHNVMLHGRSEEKLTHAKNRILASHEEARIETYLADLSRLADVKTFAKNVLENHSSLDVLINNAGILKTTDTITEDGLDIRFAVNTIAPYLLTRQLLPLFDHSGRVVNLSSAAQAPVDFKALEGNVKLDDMPAYSQSKLAITMWSFALSQEFVEGPTFIALNPGSLLATKMVKEGFGIAGSDIRIGSDIICRAALDDDFASASGQYFDNDSGRFAAPHSDATDLVKCRSILNSIDKISDRKS